MDSPVTSLDRAGARTPRRVMSDYEDRVLGLVSRPDYRPITLEEMASRYGEQGHQLTVT